MLRKAISTSLQLGQGASRRNDATVTSLEGKAAEVQADVRDKAKKLLG